MLYRRVLALK